MSHRIAELIKRGDSSVRARREASELILRCWERRRSWTSGWPRPGLEDLFRWIERGLSVEEHHGQPEDEWTRRLLQIRRSLDEEFTIWAQLAVAEEKPAMPDIDGLPFLDDELDTQEQRAARLLARLLKSSETWFKDLGPKSTTSDRVARAGAKIEELTARRNALLVEVTSATTPANTARAGTSPDSMSPGASRRPAKGNKTPQSQDAG